MRFPLIKNKNHDYPAKFKCAWCQERKVGEPHSMAILSGGALLMDRKRKDGGPDDKLDGFFSFTWHGAHTNEGGIGRDADMYETLQIAKDVRGGQFSLYFCSTKCLRIFLNHAVDNLEEKIKKTRGKSQEKNTGSRSG